MLAPYINGRKSIGFTGVITNTLFIGAPKLDLSLVFWPNFFHYTACLMTGSLFHGLWNNPLQKWVRKCLIPYKPNKQPGALLSLLNNLQENPVSLSQPPPALVVTPICCSTKRKVHRRSLLLKSRKNRTNKIPTTKRCYVWCIYI